MSNVEPAENAEQSFADLKRILLREVFPVFRASTSPQVSEGEVELAVEVFFALIKHRIGDPNLDGMGAQIIECLARGFRERQHVKIADRFEPFAKFVLKLVFPKKYDALAATLRHKFTLAEVLKELGLAEDSELKAWSLCPWQQFPPVGLPGTPNFKEQIGWTVRFRNTEDHLAPELDNVREAKLVQSVCVCFVWLTAKLLKEIQRALLTARFCLYLRKLRDNSEFKDTAARYVELLTETRSAEEYRFLDPLAAAPEVSAADEALKASELPEKSRMTVIEAGPGAGKTMTLQFLAWRHADKLLSGENSEYCIPVYLELKLVAYRKETIEAAIHSELDSRQGTRQKVPWDSLLLLVDGLNEVAPPAQTNFKAELKDLLAKHPMMQAVVAGRPNSFRGEFAARIVVLRRLTDRQLLKLFGHALNDEHNASELLIVVQKSPFLLSWSRTPLHAAMIARFVREQGIEALTNHAQAVRDFVRRHLKREEGQAPGQTVLILKERLLSHLAFETKSCGQLSFSQSSALQILGSAKISSPKPNVPTFLHEVLNNHILNQSEGEALGFAHELYHDYFAATELEAREGLKAGLGTDFALLHFHDVAWSECIRLFAGFANASGTLIERGAEKNPMLAWLLLKDAFLADPQLNQIVVLAAYSVFEGDLSQHGKAAIAQACLPVLADLGRSDLIEQAIIRQRQILEPAGLWKLSKDARREEEMKIQEAIVPLGYGLISVLRIGSREERDRHGGSYSKASRVAIQALKHIKATRVLTAILASWAGTTFEASSLIPGRIVDALIDLGVDKLLDQEVERLNKVLAQWLRVASETEFAKAWPAYGRVLRLASRPYVTGIDFDPDAALKWLQKSHEAGDVNGSIELALLLIEEKQLSNEVGQGERLLRSLAETNNAARYELGLRLLKGEDLPKSEAEGFEHLLSAAESGHADALIEVNPFICGQIDGPPPHIGLPAWAKPYRDRLTALFPENHWPLL